MAWTAQLRLGEWWFLCARCNVPTPHSRTTYDPSAYAVSNRAKRLCPRCIDAPARDDMLDVRSARLASTTSREAESHSPPIGPRDDNLA